MTSSSRLLASAACFVLALGLPFGRTADPVAIPGPVLLNSILVQEPGTLEYSNGETIAVPGRMRLQYYPWPTPPVVVWGGGAGIGRTTAARVPLVALLGAALLAWRRRSISLARPAAIVGGGALVLMGLLGALPSAGATVAALGVALLASVGGPARAPVGAV